VYALIAVDWGTSNLRAFRLNADGEVIDRRSVASGILSVEPGRFAEVLRNNVGDWLAAGESRILLSGMVGSRNGWVEAPYLHCPATIAAIADASVPLPFDGLEARLIPGIQGTDSNGIPEVMRGEETEIAGMLAALAQAGTRSALVCLPGTHSKWVQVEGEAIVSFQTCMTGEVFSALRTSTILGRTMSPDNEIQEAAFLRGVARSADAGGLLHHLFGVRSLYLMNLLKEEDSASFLSGLLIGHEVRSAMLPGAHVHLSAAAQLGRLYSFAIEACGGTAGVEDEYASVRGHIAIARRLQWI
jgi:2-dehydro-3-deoxygalactonokinase